MDHSRQKALAEWRLTQAQGKEETLPSGLPVLLKRVEVLDLVANGTVPAPLLGVVEQMQQAERVNVTMAHFSEFADLINLVCKAALLEPAVADVADAEHLAITELPMSDRLWVFNWTQGPAVKVAPFREEPEQPVADPQPG